MISSLYLHIPFCDNICSYCDFSKVLTGSSSQKEYIDCLLDEIESLNIEDRSLKTVYLGGGTPSALNPESLEKLLSYLDHRFYPVVDFTMEANPESLTPRKIQLLKQYHVNRVSIGVQTVNPELLKYLNRKHSIDDVRRCVSDLRKNGIENINLDFIYGIPGSTFKDIEDDLSFVIEIDPSHVSFYSLQIEEGTLFYVKKIKPMDDSILREQYDRINIFLKNHGYYRYEVSNFSKKGYQSLHNRTYWKDEEYYACGVSASGYIQNRRYTNTRSITNYLKGKRILEEETLTEKEQEFEFLMLNLRLQEGFSIFEFNRRFHQDFLTSYQKEIEDCRDDIELKNGRIRIKEEKLYIMDSVLLKLLKEY